MRILVIGAGAIGGYFGGRLLEAGRNVTFLVRPRRAAQLAASGLVIKSPVGDFTHPAPPTVLAENLRAPFDLILLSTKAYDLEGAIAAFAPAVGPDTLILPLLNGMRHLDRLDRRFGASHVLGGQCVITATLDRTGATAHLAAAHDLTFGERDGALSDRVRAIAAAMDGAKFNSRASATILHEMWEKWVFLATLAASTSLMRAAIGDILETQGGADFILGVFGECSTIAEASGFPLRAPALERAHTMLGARGSLLTASMLRDIENHAPTEADHIIGDLIRRGKAAVSSGDDFPRLETAYLSLLAYEVRRQRELSPQ